ncbi:MAG: polysaccharide deacetylase family protein [Oscillospiraceae bacterium]|nr:polysaccharide deacetylase family protein [Oscillospiraceae bacterium]
MRKNLQMIGALCSSAVLLFTSMPTLNVSAETESKLLALAFDDGPNTTTTNEVLDLLAEYNAKASFFVIGVNINDESAKSIKRAYDMGMEIDNHSKTHTSMMNMTPEEIKEEIDYVDEKVEEITGEKTKCFRPPFIGVSQVMYDTIDLPFIYGADTQDYMTQVDAQERADNILKYAKDGAIYLMHDAAGNDQTVEALKIALPQLAEQGYEFVTISELFERQGETPKKNILYSSVTKYPCKNYSLYQEISTDSTDTISLDKSTLKSLGDTFAVEMNYTSTKGNPPVIALQRWTSEPSLWHAVQPSYSNGDRAVFLASDILSAFEELDIGYDDIDGISISAYGGELTLSDVKLLVNSGSDTTIVGDVNADGKFDVADVVLLQKWLLAVPNTKLPDWKTADFCQDNKLDVFDLCLMKRALLNAEKMSLHIASSYL